MSPLIDFWAARQESFGLLAEKPQIGPAVPIQNRRLDRLSLTMRLPPIDPAPNQPAAFRRTTRHGAPTGHRTWGKFGT